jgi:hypothetical protein
MSSTLKRPRGRPPMSCYRIDSVTYGRKTVKAKTALRSKMCLSRSTKKYPPYRCRSTPTGCKTSAVGIRTGGRKPASRYAKRPTTGARTGGRKPASKYAKKPTTGARTGGRKPASKYAKRPTTGKRTGGRKPRKY